MTASKKDFIAESEELLSEAESHLVEIQETYSSGLRPDTLNSLFRSVHTIKGISGIFGFRNVTDFAHSFESLLDDIRLGKIELSADILKFLFTNMDLLKRIIREEGDSSTEDISGYLISMEAFREAAKKGSGASAAEGLFAGIDKSIISILSEYEEHRLKTNIKENKGIYLKSAVYSLVDFEKELNDLTALIKSHGELISMFPESKDLPPDLIRFNLMIGSSMSLDGLKELLGDDIKEMISCRSVPAPEAPHEIPKEMTLKSSTSFVRVDIEKLDRILDTISELSLAISAINRVGKEMMDLYGHTPIVVDVLKISQVFSRRITELQGQLLEIRMIPIGQIFSRLSQVVRRYSVETGKRIDILLYGEETEIDKYLAEEIADPLMHIIRNAIDHGIEPAEVRKSTGKKESGTIVLKALQRGNHVIIEVKDDGAGIDIEGVRKKAIEKGLLSHDSKPDERELLDFIFMPGFSTKSNVTDISGRGVGLDVVKQKLSLFGGFVDIATARYSGTTITVTMPITLAVLRALIVRIGKERFAIPLTSMSETFAAGESDIQTIEGREVYNLREEPLPIIRLSRVFGIMDDGSDTFFAVVTGFGERRAGLVVDELIGHHEIIIKSLSDYLKGYSGLAGAAEIGKHEVILVIDVESVIGKFISAGRGDLILKAVSHV